MLNNQVTQVESVIVLNCFSACLISAPTPRPRVSVTVNGARMIVAWYTTRRALWVTACMRAVLAYCEVKYLPLPYLAKTTILGTSRRERKSVAQGSIDQDCFSHKNQSNSICYHTHLHTHIDAKAEMCARQ